MKVAEKFLRNNFIVLILGLDIFYIIIFFILFLLRSDLELALNSVIDITANNPAFALILIHPILLGFFIAFNSRENSKYNAELDNQLKIQNKKIEEVNTFVEQLRLGQSNLQFSQEFQQDKLVRSLLNMRDNIDKTRKEDELRQIEEKQRHWVNEGLAKFGAILRENVENLDQLAANVTSNITKYLNCQQAGFFIIKDEEDEKVLEMIALFAFDRKKFPNKQIKWGEGLIGACAIEQKTIFLKDTTENFVDITSGLGKANPRAILIAPIKDSENIVHGVIELASFNVFEAHEISFIEQVAESIGLTIANIKTGLRTRELLTESQKQAEMLAQQEETMRHNIEEIEKGREEANQRATEFQIYSDSVNQAIIRIDIDTNGDIIFANEVSLQIFDYESQEDIIGQKFINLIETRDKDWYNNSFHQILETNEKFHNGLQMLTSTGKHLWIVSAFIPVLNVEGKLSKIMFLAVERTDTKIQIRENEQAMYSFVNLAYKADFNLDGSFSCASPNFYELIGLDKEQLTKKTIFDLIPEKQIEQLKVIWKNIEKGKEYQSEQIFISENKKETITNAFFSPVKNIDDSIMKISLFATDITELVSTKTELSESFNKLEKTKKEVTKLTKESFDKIEQTKIQIEKKYKEKAHVANIYDNLFQNIDSGLIIFENDTVVVFNSIAEQLWGFRRDISIGKKSKYLFPKNPTNSEDNLYLGNVILKGITESQDEKQLFILDRNMKKIEVFAKITYFEFENKSLIAISLKLIK